MTGDQNMDQQQSDLSSLLEYSKALNQSASSLLKAAQSFERTADKFLKGFDKSSQNLTDNLDRQAKAYDNKQKKDREEREKQEKEYSKDFADELELDNRRRHAENTRMQRYGTAFISSLRTVGSFFIKSFTGAYTRVSDAYEQNLERITTSLQITNREYTTQLNNITKQIWGQGLAKQFSQIDWQRAMGDTLSTGLRGEAATNMAYRNMIANKLLPAIQTNTRAYVQMSKRFGEDFEKNILAFGKHVEKIYGAEGLEQGKIDQMLNTLQAQIRYTAAQKGLSTEDANKVINRLIAYTSLLESNSIESDEFIQNLYETATTTPGGLSNIMSYVNGIGTPGQAGKTLTSGLDRYFANYISGYLVDGSNANAMVARTSALGGNVQNAYAINAAFGFGQVDLESILADVSKTVDDFESGKVYNGLIDQLTSGRYSSATTQYEKWMENQTAIIANEITNVLPHNTQVLASVWQIVRAWFNAWQAGQVGGTLSRSNGVRNFLNRDLGLRNGYTSGVTSRGTTWYRNAATNRFVSASEAQRVGFGGATTVGSNLLNIAAGPGALIAGAGWTAYDAVRAGIAADKAGLGTGGAIGSVFRGMLTGGMADDKATKNSKVAAALRGERVKFNWGDVAKNAGKGALIGTGIGTAAGGWAAGTGTVVGAVAGGIVGAAANAVDQLVQNAKYNKLADATKKLTESIENLDSATADYKSTVTKINAVEKAWKIVRESENKGTKEYTNALEVLKQAYPEYTKTLNNLTGKEDKLEKILHARIDAELAMSGEGLGDRLDETVKNLEGYKKASDKITGGNDRIIKSAWLDATKSLYSLLEYDDSGNVTADSYKKMIGQYDQVIKNTSSKYRLSDAETKELEKSVQSLTRAGWGQAVLRANNEIEYIPSSISNAIIANKDYFAGLEANNSGIYGFTDEEWAEYIQKNTRNLANAQGAYESAVASMRTILSAFYDYDGNLRSGLTKSSPQVLQYNTAKDRLVEIADIYNEMLRNTYGPEADRVTSADAFGDNLEGLRSLSSIGVKPFSYYKVGSYNIGEDNTPALLHAGEMVLTSSDANALRELASGQGVRGLLSGLLSISRASAVAADDSTTAANPIIEAIHLQTRTLSEHLVNILSEVKEISRIQRNQSSVSSGVSRDLRTYQGV